MWSTQLVNNLTVPQKTGNASNVVNWGTKQNVANQHRKKHIADKKRTAQTKTTGHRTKYIPFSKKELKGNQTQE